ncbi:fungal-specific transcription factor domain-containing protein [Mycena filopes]|nr:fungal-specific transcription factor domain-containing protein [Mycena filopes]
MSPATGHTDSSLKRRRQERSCDFCRQRKARCDGLTMPEQCCSNCLAFGSPCTYVLPAKVRGPKIKNGTMEELRKTVESLKQETESLRTENTALKAQILRSHTICPRCGPWQDNSPTVTTSVFPSSTHENVASTVAVSVSDDEDFTDELSSRFSQFTFKPMARRYFNSGGSWALAKNAMAAKEQYLGQHLESRARRPLYWNVLPWEEHAYVQDDHYVYPPDDLIDSLLQLYFANVHPTIPVLHRPSFERSVAEGLHSTDMQFGGLLLSVLAVASRYSDDPRVFVDDDPSVPLSAGSKFATQLKTIRFVFELTIHEVQMYSLLSLFAIGTSFPQASGIYLGIGIHFLQLHREYRQKREGLELKFEEEVWKRVFWSYVALERMACVFQGRPTAMPIEDYNVDFPLEVDDEYWDRGFVQPLGKPSVISAFTCQSRLSEILGATMHRLYGSFRTKIALGWTGPEWEQTTVAELDSAMNDFLESIPPNLRWNSDDPPYGPFFDQSATLHIAYYLVQIMIHRPFIHKPSQLTAPSFSICTRAARTILHTADIWLKTMHRAPLPHVMNAVFISGTILVLTTFASRRPNIADPAKDLRHVKTALEILKFGESRWQVAGRLWEILRELSSLDPPKYPSNGELELLDPEVSKPLADPVPASSDPHVFLPQHQHLASTETPDFMPGMSIEQLLADTNSLESMKGILDTDFMSMWIDPPIGDVNSADWDNFASLGS